MDRQRKEGGQAWSDHRLHPERVLREQEAHTVIVASGHKGLIQNMTTGALQADTSHILIAADSRAISMYTEQLSVILSCPRERFQSVNEVKGHRGGCCGEPGPSDTWCPDS